MIIDIARRHKIDLRISLQPWGAVLAKEPKKNFMNLKPILVIVEQPGLKKEEELRSQGYKIIIIDHHKYSDGLNRYQKLSSLEQFAQLIGHHLNRFEKGLAINDRAWIYGLVKAGYSKKEIMTIRDYDLRAQGLNNQIKRTLAKIAEKSPEFPRGIVICNMPHTLNVSYLRDKIAFRDTTRIISSLIYKRYQNGRLALIVFTGQPKLAIKLVNKFGGSLGGDRKFSMVWTTTENIVKVVEKFIFKNLK